MFLCVCDMHLNLEFPFFLRNLKWTTTIIIISQQKITFMQIPNPALYTTFGHNCGAQNCGPAILRNERAVIHRYRRMKSEIMGEIAMNCIIGTAMVRGVYRNRLENAFNERIPNFILLLLSS